MSVVFPPLEQLRTRTSAKWRTYDADVIPAFVAEIDVELADPIAQALRAAVDRSDTGYRWPNDLPEVLADFTAAAWDWTIEPSRVTVLPDVCEGIVQALRVLTQPNDGVVITSPVYPPFWTIVERSTGRTVVDVPLVRDDEGRYALDLEALDAAFARPEVTAFLLCSPHNPTGTVPTAAELTHIADSALRHGVAVIADEIHATLTHHGSTHTPFLQVAPEELDAVALVSASKGWNLAGLKCSQLVAGSASVAQRLTDAIASEVLYETGHFGVIASIAAYRDGRTWLDEFTSHIAGNARLIDEAIRTRMPGIRYVPPQASYLAWLDCAAVDLPVSPGQFFLDQARVALNPGAPFGPQGTSFVRLNFGTSPEILAEILDRMANALDRGRA